MISGRDYPSVTPPLRRHTTISGAAQEGSGGKGPGSGGPADEDDERPRAQDAQGLSGKGTGSELDGGEVQHGEKAGVSDITTDGRSRRALPPEVA